MTCAWCREPRHRDARGRFVKAIEACLWARYCYQNFLATLDEMMQPSPFDPPRKRRTYPPQPRQISR